MHRYLLKRTFPIITYWLALMAAIITLYDFLVKPHPPIFYWLIIFLISIIATIYIIYLIYRFRIYEIISSGDKEQITEAINCLIRKVEKNKLKKIDLAGLLYLWFTHDDIEHIEETAVHFLDKLQSSKSTIKNWDLIVNKLLLSNKPQIVESAKSFLNNRANKNAIELFYIFERQDKKLQDQYFNVIKNVIENDASLLSDNMIEALLTRISKAMLENPHENITHALFNTLKYLWSKVSDKAQQYKNSEFEKNLAEFLKKQEYPISNNFLLFQKDFFSIIVDIDGPNLLNWTEEKFKLFKEKANKPKGTLDYIFFKPIAESLSDANSKILSKIILETQK